MKKHNRAMTIRKPNILWICTDQQRYDTIRCLGNPHIHTPNLDRLCREGVAFSRAYCQSPICSPSRASFLTGLYPSTVHVNRNGNEYFPDNFRLITRILADAGYDCGLAGKLHIASPWTGWEKRTDDGYRVFHYSLSPAQGIGKGNQYTDWLQKQGIDPHDIMRWKVEGNQFLGYKPDVPTDLHQTTWCADRAIEFMNEKREGPWLMSVNVFDPHHPFDAPRKYRERYDAEKLPAPLFRESDLVKEERLKEVYHQTEKPFVPDENTQEVIASYYAMVELVDEQVGRMIDALEASGQRDDTIIIFTSDHGEMLGDHGLIFKGCRFYEGAVHVPLIVSWPGHFREGLICDSLVELTDLAPTLADVGGVTLGPTHSKSLLPLLKGEPDYGPHRNYVRCEYYDALNMSLGTTHHYRKEDLFKGYVPYTPPEHIPTYGTMYFDGRYKIIVYHGLDFGELYDLETDPGEYDNLWESQALSKVKMDLLKRSFDASIVITDPGPLQIGRY